MSKKEKTISLKIDDQMYRDLKVLADRDMRTASGYIRMLINNAISESKG